MNGRKNGPQSSRRGPQKSQIDSQSSDQLGRKQGDLYSVFDNLKVEYSDIVIIGDFSEPSSNYFFI